MERPKRGTIGFQHTAPKIIREVAHVVAILNSIRSRLNFAIKMWEKGADNTDGGPYAPDDGLYLSPQVLVETKKDLQQALAIVEHHISVRSTEGR